MSRLIKSGLAPSQEPVAIRFDGESISCYEGETIAAALTAAGRLGLRRTKEAAPRGVFCGMGICHDCLVSVDGQRNLRACMTLVRAGMEVHSECHDAPIPARGIPILGEPPLGPETPSRNVEVLVIGAGPAGLSASIAAASAGASVVVIDERDKPGGQYFKQRSDSFPRTLNLDAQFRAGARLIEEAQRNNIEILTGALVWGGTAKEIWAVVNGGALVLQPKKLIIATGAHEVAYPVPGWTLPGVMTTGAAQTMARSHLVSPGRRVVICGNGPLNFQVAVELIEGGVQVVAVVEAAPSPGLKNFGSALRALVHSPSLMRDGARYLHRLRRAKVPILWGNVVTAIEGNGRARTIRIAPAAQDCSRASIDERRIEADAVCLGYGFAPNAELARQIGCTHLLVDGAMPVPERNSQCESNIGGVFIVGDCAGPNGAKIALAEGAIAGFSAASALGHRLSEPLRKDLKRQHALCRSHRAFQKALWKIFAPTPGSSEISDDTILCRCESVKFGEARRLMQGDTATLSFVKQRTRAGMGRCQGRYCGPLLGKLLAQRGNGLRSSFGLFAPRPPLKPVSISAIACEKPEWSDYRRVPAPAIRNSAKIARKPNLKADILIIGGGAMGAATALPLAHAGFDTLLVDIGAVNSQTSGANAGSLHVQLTSKDFGARAGGGSKRVADALRLNKESVRIWGEIAASADCDLEYKIGGGIMVAESDEQLRYLESKIALERSHGIDSELLTRADLRRHAPYVAEFMAGAALCRDEGKINPLLATDLLVRQAQACGARILPHTGVTGLQPTAGGYEATTENCNIFSKQVINAAGVWSPAIAAMLGIELPVTAAPLQMLVTEPVEHFIPHLVAHAGRHLTLKQAANGGIMIGGAWPAAFDPVTAQYGVLRESVEGNLWVAHRIVPSLGHFRLLRAWAAMNVLTDGAPIIGPVPGHPGFHVVVSVSGYTLAPVLGRLVAEYIATGKPFLDIAPYSITRFGAH